MKKILFSLFSYSAIALVKYGQGFLFFALLFALPFLFLLGISHSHTHDFSGQREIEMAALKFYCNNHFFSI